MAIHLQEFDIHQFRGIHNLELKDLNHINIITGDNNTGKTRILIFLKELIVFEILHILRLEV